MSVAVMTMHNNDWEKRQNSLIFVRPKIPFIGLFTPFVIPSVGHHQPIIRTTAFLRYSGFTLTELIIALAIAALLLTLAAPNMSSFIRNNRITTETNTLIAHVNLARSEATKRSCVVALCRRDPAQALPTCGGGTANDWTSGWLLYAPKPTVPAACSTTTAVNFNAANYDLLKEVPTITNGVTVTSNAAGNLLIGYKPDGQLTVAGTLRFSMCDDRPEPVVDATPFLNEAHGKNITILATGRPSLAKTGAAGTATDCTPG